jgi:hypothetical protein
MDNKKFLIGSKLGDFIHCLYAVKCLSEGEKSDVYLLDEEENFMNGLKSTYYDSYPVMIQQPYINNLLLYQNYKNVVNITDLRNWNTSDLMFKKNWYDILEKTNNIDGQKQAWLNNINTDKEYDYYENKVVIHFVPYRYENVFDPLLDNIIKNNDCVLLVNNEDDEFLLHKYKNLEVKRTTSFTEIYSIIQKCKFFVGNQSMPIAIAHGLFKPHIGFLFKAVAVFYKDNYNKNYFWIDDRNKISENFYGIHNFIKLDNMEIVPIIIDVNGAIFNTRYNIDNNLVFISCNKTVEVDVIISDTQKVLYEYKTDFNIGPEFGFTINNLKNIEKIKIQIKDNDKIIKEEILKIKNI